MRLFIAALVVAAALGVTSHAHMFLMWANYSLGAAQKAAARVVFLEVTVADKPPARLASREGDMSVLEIEGVGRFGLLAKVADAEGKQVAIDIFDLAKDDKTPVGKVTAATGGETVESSTTPRFRIRVRQVTAPKSDAPAIE